VKSLKVFNLIGTFCSLHAGQAVDLRMAVDIRSDSLTEVLTEVTLCEGWPEPAVEDKAVIREVFGGSSAGNFLFLVGMPGKLSGCC
jgi:hypothetical protein